MILTTEQNNQIYKAMQMLDECGQLDWQINPRDPSEVQATVCFIKYAGAGKEFAYETKGKR